MIARMAFGAAAFAALAIATPVFAQATASTTGTGSITVIRPLTITKNADLLFGTVVKPATGSGTVTVSTAGARSVTGSVVGLSSGNTPQASQFTVGGEGGQSISVTIPSTFTMTNGTDTLTVTTSNNLSGSASAQTLSNALGASGSLAFNVGGVTTVASTISTGAYSGTFTVSAAYN